jgi:hypothetical protein
MVRLGPRGAAGFGGLPGTGAEWRVAGGSARRGHVGIKFHVVEWIVCRYDVSYEVFYIYNIIIHTIIYNNIYIYTVRIL